MGRRRAAAIVGLLCVAAVSAAGLAGTLTGCTPQHPLSTSTSRLVNADQAGRLAMTRLANYQDGQATFRAVIDATGGDVHVTGWIDWSRPLIYLNSAAENAGPADGLVQAVPGVVAVHAGRYAATADDPYPLPPATPPTDGWRVRQMDPASGGSAFDALLALLFSLAAPAADDAHTILAGDRTAVQPGQLDGVAVDVYSGPAIASPGQPAPGTPTTAPDASPAPTSPASTAPMPPVDGTVQYWLDGTGRMRRVVASLGGSLPVQVDLARTGKQVLVTVPMLGGAPVTPRPLTDDELKLLSRMRMRDRDSGGGTVTLELPVNPAGLTTATGWLDWRAAVGYLALHDPDDPGQDQLVRIERTGLATRDGTTGTEPPLRPPSDGWHFSAWSGRGDAGGASDLDILLTQAVTMTDTRVDDQDALRMHASFLRTDVLAGVPVVVIEIRQATEGSTAGSGRLRYWMDRDGQLRRIEVRTRQGGYGWLDITPGQVPALPHPATS